MPAEPGGLAGKVVIVTGAGRGIGQATALALGRAGASLVLNELDGPTLDQTAASLAEIGAAHIRVAGSVADWALAETLASSAIAHFGRLDGLVNNAGLHYQAMPWDENEGQVRRTVEVNVLGPMFCGIHAIRAMRQHGGGAIVNICSGAMLGVDARGVYSATKGAVASLTLGWARDLAADGIRVNALAPLAATRMTVAEEGDPGGAGAPQWDTLAGPGEIAPVICHLLSDRSHGISGKIFRFTGHDLCEIEPARHGALHVQHDLWTDDDMAAAVARIVAAR